MPDWRVNALEGIYKFGTAYPMQKRYHFLQSTQHMEVLRSVHVKTAYLTTRLEQSVKSSSRPAIVKLMLRVVSSPDLCANYSSPIGELAGLSPGCRYWLVSTSRPLSGLHDVFSLSLGQLHCFARFLSSPGIGNCETGRLNAPQL